MRARRLSGAAVVAAGALAAHVAACGDDMPLKPHDAAIDGDGSAMQMPQPPVLGAQLDRMGRPGIADALIAAFASSGSNAGAQKDAYNQAADPATWKTTPVRPNVTIADELKASAAPYDAIDNGLVAGPLTLTGCANALFYAGPPGAQSYGNLASVLGDDQILVDTSRGSCTYYLALEIEVASAATHIHDNCGGRTLQYDAYDALISVLAAGISGLDTANQFVPRLRGSATAHVDVKASFPFLGEPH